MSVSIRLTKTGKKNAPSFRVVATKTHNKRDGRHLEILGYFNPSHNPSQVSLNNERIEYWQSVGAIKSAAVKRLEEGSYVYTKYEPKGKKEV